MRAQRGRGRAQVRWGGLGCAAARVRLQQPSRQAGRQAGRRAERCRQAGRPAAAGAPRTHARTAQVGGAAVHPVQARLAALGVLAEPGDVHVAGCRPWGGGGRAKGCASGEAHSCAKASAARQLRQLATAGQPCMRRPAGRAARAPPATGVASPPTHQTPATRAAPAGFRGRSASEPKSQPRSSSMSVCTSLVGSQPSRPAPTMRRATSLHSPRRACSGCRPPPLAAEPAPSAPAPAAPGARGRGAGGVGLPSGSWLLTGAGRASACAALSGRPAVCGGALPRGAPPPLLPAGASR